MSVSSVAIPGRLWASRPASTWRGYLNRQHLTCACPWPRSRYTGFDGVAHLLNVGQRRIPAPLDHRHVQRPPVASSEHARSAEEIQIDHLHQLTALANTDAPLTRTAPDGVFGVQTDAVGAEFAQFGPQPPLRQATVGRDVEDSQPLAVRLSHNQPRVVRRHRHAVGEREAVRHPPGRAIRGDQGDGPEFALEAEGPAVDVGIAPAVDDDLV